MLNVTTILVAGVDEVGRGPLAGAVVTAAVILDPNRPIAGLNDSKKLTERKREQLAQLIRKHALAWSLGRAEVEEIDQLNILQATFLAMQRAVAGLSVAPEHILIDGPHCPVMPCPTQGIIGGDALVPAISAASILAKVARDQELMELDKLYPQYGFAKHKGYPTPAHLAALEQFGILPIHRRSFKPVKKFINPQ